MTTDEVKVRNALSIAAEFGQIDGAHHKAWCIDQMVRVLTGRGQGYIDWVEDYEEDGEYWWDEGTAP